MCKKCKNDIFCYCGQDNQMTDKQLLKHVSNYLRTCAESNTQEGWLTYQVQSQRKMADKIDLHIYQSEERQLVNDSNDDKDC